MSGLSVVNMAFHSFIILVDLRFVGLRKHLVALNDRSQQSLYYCFGATSSWICNESELLMALASSVKMKLQDFITAGRSVTYSDRRWFQHGALLQPAGSRCKR